MRHLFGAEFVVDEVVLSSQRPAMRSDKTCWYSKLITKARNLSFARFLKSDKDTYPNIPCTVVILWHRSGN